MSSFSRASIHAAPSRAIICAAMIYLIYKDGEILVETDNIDFAKDYVKTDPECSVRDARTGKKIPLE
jgi:hypothetical protein